MQMESEPRATERRLHRVGVRLVAPVAAAAFIAEGLRIDDGARMAAFPTCCLRRRSWRLCLTFLGACFGFMIGFSPVGSLAGHGIAGPSIKRAARSVASVALSEARSPVWHSRSTTPSDNGFPGEAVPCAHESPRRRCAGALGHDRRRDDLERRRVAISRLRRSARRGLRAAPIGHRAGRLHLPNTPTTYTHATTSGCTRTPW